MLYFFILKLITICNISFFASLHPHPFLVSYCPSLCSIVLIIFPYVIFTIVIVKQLRCFNE